MHKQFKNIEDFQKAVISFNIEIDRLNEKHKTTVSSILLLNKPIDHLSKIISIELDKATNTAALHILAPINNTDLKNEILSKAESIFDL